MRVAGAAEGGSGANGLPSGLATAVPEQLEAELALLREEGAQVEASSFLLDALQGYAHAIVQAQLPRDHAHHSTCSAWTDILLEAAGNRSQVSHCMQRALELQGLGGSSSTGGMTTQQSEAHTQKREAELVAILGARHRHVDQLSSRCTLLEVEKTTLQG